LFVILAGSPAVLTEDFGDFTQSPQTDSGIVAVLSHGRFLANPFQLIIYASIRCCVGTDGVIKQPTEKKLHFVFTSDLLPNITELW
jgi:hypothetical protein